MAKGKEEEKEGRRKGRKKARNQLLPSDISSVLLSLNKEKDFRLSFFSFFFFFKVDSVRKRSQFASSNIKKKVEHDVKLPKEKGKEE